MSIDSDNTFGKAYSNCYDQLYEDKDYIAECDFLENLFTKYKLKPQSILDVGCGTGNHLIPLSKRGYKVAGIDRSDHMLHIAENKTLLENIQCNLYQGDITNVDLGKKFDAIISMFTVMGYLNSNEQLASACKTVFDHLHPNGCFIFDVWYGPGVLMWPPTKMFKSKFINNKEIIRFADANLDPFKHKVEINYKFWEIEDNKVNSSGTESHSVRYVFPQEIAYFLTVAGFKTIDYCPFMDVDKALSDSDWNMTVIARP